MARSSKTKPKPNPNPEDMIVNVEDFLAETQAFGKQMEFIIATLRHSAALSNTDVSHFVSPSTATIAARVPKSLPIRNR